MSEIVLGSIQIEMGLEKVLILLGIDDDGLTPTFDTNGNMMVNRSVDPSMRDTQGYVAMQFNRVKALNPNAKYKIVSNFQEFDNAINEKQREKIIMIAHGYNDAIALNAHDFNSDKSSRVTWRTLNNDDQTSEQQARLAQTQMELLSCNTGQDPGIFADSIAQNIQEHYQFKFTSAPNATINSDGIIYNNSAGVIKYGEMVNFY